MANDAYTFILTSTEITVQFSSVAQSCLTLCNPMNCSMPGLPVHHQLPEFIQTHVHRVGDATQPSHPLSSPSPPAPNPSQHQGLFQWVNSSHEVAKVWSLWRHTQKNMLLTLKKTTLGMNKFNQQMLLSSFWEIGNEQECLGKWNRLEKSWFYRR